MYDSVLFVIVCDVWECIIYDMLLCTLYFVYITLWEIVCESIDRDSIWSYVNKVEFTLYFDTLNKKENDFYLMKYEDGGKDYNRVERERVERYKHKAVS